MERGQDDEHGRYGKFGTHWYLSGDDLYHLRTRPALGLPDAIEGMIFLSLRRGQELMQQAALAPVSPSPEKAACLQVQDVGGFSG